MLYGLLLVPYHEFLLYPGVDKSLIQQSQKIIQEFILEESGAEIDNTGRIQEHFWVIDKDGFPVKMPKWKTSDPTPSTEVIKKGIDNATLPEHQINENRHLQNIEERDKQILLRTKLFMGFEGVTILSDQLSSIPINRLFFLFSIRFTNVLKKCEKIKSLQDLLNTTDKELLRVRNCGIKSINDTKSLILSLKLSSFLPFYLQSHLLRMVNYRCIIFHFLMEKELLDVYQQRISLIHNFINLNFLYDFNHFLRKTNR
jgi:hypothetical protein